MLILASVALAATSLTACGEKTPSAGADVIVDASTLSREHAEGPLGYDLSKSVPVGGVHNARWAACQVWYTPVAPEYAIHSMEHGAVWVAYVAMMSDPEVADLVELSAKYPYLLATPHESLPAPIVASAWGVQIKLNSTKDPRLEEFIAKYAQGPQTPEPGAPCAEGGLTSPVEASTVGAAVVDNGTPSAPAVEPDTAKP
jgi:predicted small secreted protein